MSYPRGIRNINHCTAIERCRGRIAAHEWLDDRPGFIAGGVLTDRPEGAIRLFSEEQRYIPQTGETHVYQTWVCA